MSDTDISYYRRRAAEELAAADQATHHAAAAAHEQMARRYAAVLGELSREALASPTLRPSSRA
jgi:hypothetical protein